MPDEVQPSRTMSWSDWFPNFTPLFRAFRMSYKPGQLGLAFAAVLLLALWGLFLDSVWPEEHGAAVMLDGSHITASDLRIYVETKLDHTTTDVWRSAVPKRAGPFHVLFDYARVISNEFLDAVFSARILNDAGGNHGLLRVALKPPATVMWLVIYHPLYALFFLVGALLIFSVFGGAVHRLAALFATREDVVGVGEGVRFAWSKLVSFAFTPVLPVGLILVGLGILALGGLILGYGWFSVIAALIWFLPLLAGLILAVLLVGTITGWPLWFPTIAVEGSDVFDAFSRSFSYVFQRPWRAIFYAIISLIYGVLCYAFVRFFVWLLFVLVHTGVGWGMNVYDATGVTGAPISNKLDSIWTRPTMALPFWGAIPYDQLSSASKITSLIIGFFTVIVVLLVAAWVLSFFCSASTLIYLLLRRDVDGTDPEDIWVEEEDDLLDSPAAPQPAGAAAASSTSLPVVEPPRSPPPDRPPGTA